MLAYTPQIWTSDNTDAIQRLYIQFGTSMCYPASSMGAHVSARRRTPLKTRADVAMWGSFGYELDPRSFTDEEKALVREQVAEYHKNYSLVHTGDLYRLISPFENPYLAAWQLVSEDRRESLITLVTLRAQPRRNLIIRARGLDPDARYKNTLTGEITSGALLMNAGLVIHSSYGHDGESLTVRIEAVE
jgi:alpha-galactosidase